MVAINLSNCGICPMFANSSRMNLTNLLCDKADDVYGGRDVYKRQSPYRTSIGKSAGKENRRSLRKPVAPSLPYGTRICRYSSCMGL